MLSCWYLENISFFKSNSIFLDITMIVCRVKNKNTPLIDQYNKVKNEYPDSLILFRVGDFYETFGDDAIRASKILGIVLTNRSNGSSKVELARFPFHSLDNYLPKLDKKG